MNVSSQTCQFLNSFPSAFKMDKEILKKRELDPKGSLSKTPLWPKMFGIASLRLAISKDIDGLSLAEMTAVSQKTPQAALWNTTFLPGTAEEEPALPWTWNRWQPEKDKAFATYSYSQQFCNTFDCVQALCSTLVPELTGVLRNSAAPFYLLRTEPDLFKFSFLFAVLCVFFFLFCLVWGFSMCLLDFMSKRKEGGKK